MAERGDIAEIRERVDMVELVGAKVQLKRSGKSWKGPCPFHQEKTPSFYVYPEGGNYICFGCGEKGDAFSWLMKTENLGFPEALEQLAQRTGVELKRGASNLRDPQRDEARERLFALNDEAAAFYANALLHTPAGEAGRRYVAERGLTRETAERFALGFAPEGWETLKQHLLSRGHGEQHLVEAGLLTERDDGSRYDRFRNRLMFPIRNKDGRIVGFGGRALGDARPKYLNTAQTAVFDKSANLYAIDLARDAIRKHDVAVIVEGYMDAIMAHQVGHANVVASMGTALTESQVGLIKRLAKRIVLALDSDAAGQMATLRGISTMREALDYDTEVTVDPRQLVRFERRLNTEILVLTLPEGKDPDEFLRAHPDDWPELVRRAEPLMDYAIRAVAAPIDPADAKAKSAAVEQLAPLIRELPDEIQRSHYTGLLARALRLPEPAVASTIRKLALAPPKPRPRPQPAAPTAESAPESTEQRTVRAGRTREEHLLGLLLAHPEAARDLADEVRADDFVDTANRLLWETLREAAALNPRLTTSEFLATIAREELRETAEGAIATYQSGTHAEGFPGPLRQEARDTLRLLRLELYNARFQQLRNAISEVTLAGDPETLTSLTTQLMALIAARPAFDPIPSPYFLDSRTAMGRK